MNRGLPLDYIERQYYTPPEPERQEIGRCEVCGCPVYEGDDYEYTYNGLRHCDCELKEKENEL